ncbi:hypothetical protein V865_000191 [Kwoniella europaea PYCC6329]|uniref:Uncharacterized protein n=1 Tax=Kwoniella europaea PYCC6329 TaxID=1423913 RepID=A0AAX4K9G8_9TREE
MPKAAPEDHRPARAVLHAPYPLPFVITRPQVILPPNSPTLSAPVLPTVSHEVSVPLPPASIADFPLFKHDWRKVEPAFPPIPYPLVPREEKERKRVKKLHVLKLKKSGEESSEWEIMSHSSNRIGKDNRELLGLTKQVGKISADGELDEDDPNQDENNLLIYAFVSSYQRGDFDSPDSHDDPPEPLTPTQANPFPKAPPSIHDEPPFAPGIPHRDDTPRPTSPHLYGVVGRRPTPFPDFEDAKEASGPATEEGPAWDVVSDAISGFWSDGTDADEADQESEMRETPATRTLVTPCASASRNSGKPKKRAHSPDRPLFIGQTNQVPFTFVPPARKAPSQSSISDGTRIFREGGYVSESGSVRTIRQIPRSKVNRMRVKEREKQIKRERSSTPKQRDYQRSNATPRPSPPVQPAGPPTVSSFGNPYNFPLQNMQFPQQFMNQPMMPQQSMFGLDTFLFAPIAPLLRTSEVLSSPTSNEGGPGLSNINQLPQGREPSWSPQPMSIDPRTAESQLQANGVSWPHALPDREQVTPSNASSLLQQLAGHSGMSDVDVPMPTALSRITQPQIPPQAQAQASSSKRRVSRRALAEGDDMVPLGKACHNYLNLRRKAAEKRRKVRMGVGKVVDLWDNITEDEAKDKQQDKKINPPIIKVRKPTPVQPHPLPRPQSQQQWNTTPTMGITPNGDPNLQAQLNAQAQNMYANMMMQQQAMPFNIGMPMGYYPQFNQGFQFPQAQWGMNVPSQKMFTQAQQQQQQQQWMNQASSNIPQQYLAPPSGDTFGFPTPGATPQAPTPKPHTHAGFNPFTPKSPEREEQDHKPLRKRMRSTISPSSANDLMLRNRASSSKPLAGLGSGLLSPAEIQSPERFRTNVRREQTQEVEVDMEEEDNKNWNCGLMGAQDDEEAKNKDERRNQWVREERQRVGSLGLVRTGWKGKEKEVLR